MLPWILMQGEGTLATSLPAASESYGTVLSSGTVLAKCYDATNSGINCVDAGTAGETNGTTLDASQVWKKVFDSTNNAIRVVFV